MAHVVSEQSGELPYFERLWQIMFRPDAGFGSKVERLFADETSKFGLESAFLSRIDLETETQHFEVVHAPHRTLETGNSIPLSVTYCRKTIADPEGTMVVNDALAEGWEGDPAYERLGLGSYVGTTISVENSLYGTLCFANSEPRDERITTEEKRLVEMHSQWAAYELDRRTGPSLEDPVDVSGKAVSPDQIDSMMEALRSEPRRFVLLELLDGTATSLDSLEEGIDAENAGVELHHVHLPKLDQTGYIEWDESSGTVSRGTNYLEAEPLLRLLREYGTGH
jgi:hypothetical protein